MAELNRKQKELINKSIENSKIKQFQKKLKLIQKSLQSPDSIATAFSISYKGDLLTVRIDLTNSACCIDVAKKITHHIYSEFTTSQDISHVVTTLQKNPILLNVIAEHQDAIIDNLLQAYKTSLEKSIANLKELNDKQFGKSITNSKELNTKQNPDDGLTL